MSQVSQLNLNLCLLRLSCDQVEIIRQLPSLTRLYLANNKISGTFPSISTFESRTLVELNISKNPELVNLVIGDETKYVISLISVVMLSYNPCQRN